MGALVDGQVGGTRYVSYEPVPGTMHAAASVNPWVPVCVAADLVFWASLELVDTDQIRDQLGCGYATTEDPFVPVDCPACAEWARP